MNHFFQKLPIKTIPVGIKDLYLESSNASIDELMMTMVKWGNDGELNSEIFIATFNLQSCNLTNIVLKHFFSMIAAFDRDTRHIRSARSTIEDVKQESLQLQ